MFGISNKTLNSGTGKSVDKYFEDGPAPAFDLAASGQVLTIRRRLKLDWKDRVQRDV